MISGLASVTALPVDTGCCGPLISRLAHRAGYIVPAMLDVVIGVAMDPAVDASILSAAGMITALAAVDTPSIYVAGGDVGKGAAAAVQVPSAAVAPGAAFPVLFLTGKGVAMALPIYVAAGTCQVGAGAAGYQAQASVEPGAALFPQLLAGLWCTGLAGAGIRRTYLGHAAVHVRLVLAGIVVGAALVGTALEAVVAVDHEDTSIIAFPAFIIGIAGPAINIVLGEADEDISRADTDPPAAPAFRAVP